MAQVSVGDADNRGGQARRWLAGLGILLGALVAGLALTALLSGGINFALWLYLLDVTPLRGDTWEFMTYVGVIYVAALSGAVASPMGAFLGRRVEGRRRTRGRDTITGVVAGTLVATAANVLLFFVSVYPGP